MALPDVQAALKLALEAEKKSLGTYLEFAWQTQDRSGKNMFIRLATDELEHVWLLEQQRDSLAQNDCWHPVEIPQSLVERLVPRLADKTRRIQGTSGLDQLTALRTSLDLENSAQKFYSEQAAQVDSKPAKQMFSRLAEMEQAHAELIQAELDSIQETGFWFGDREFTLEAEH